jgi:DNA-binding NarL/FixJ family response regulator
MKYQHLNESQRYGIKAYLKCGKSQKSIAKELSVSQTSTSTHIH